MIRRGSRFIYTFLAVCIGASPGAKAFANIDLVTLPDRDKTELTIYNSEDLTLVRETRTLSFTEGKNLIQFSWADTKIDPTSPQIKLADVPGLTLLDAVFPVYDTTLIIWTIEAEEPVSAPVEITYFTSGLSWRADYFVKANPEETELSLEQFTTITNNSGEDFENSATRVVVGEVDIVHTIQQLIQMNKAPVSGKKDSSGRDPFGTPYSYGYYDALSLPAEADFIVGGSLSTLEFKNEDFLASRQKAAEIVKAAVSEYHLFAVEGTQTIETGWTKALPNPRIDKIPFDLSYEIEPTKYGSQPVKLYAFRNDDEHELGESPLPEGQYYVYTSDGIERINIEGKTDHEYVPRGEKVELNLGADGLVMYEERLMSQKRQNFEFSPIGDVVEWEEVQEVELEIRNTRNRVVPIRLWYYPPADWKELEASEADFEKVDNKSWKYEFDLEANGKKTIALSIMIPSKPTSGNPFGGYRGPDPFNPTP